MTGGGEPDPGIRRPQVWGDVLLSFPSEGTAWTYTMPCLASPACAAPIPGTTWCSGSLGAAQFQRKEAKDPPVA